MKCGRALSTILSTIILLLWTSTTFGSDIQNLESLTLTAKDYAQSKVSSNANSRTEIIIGKLDPRLTLTACTSDLIAFTPPGARLQGNSTVGVRCTTPKPWSIYISVRIAIFQQAIVASNKIPRGQIISENDIKLDEVDVSKIRGRSFIDKQYLIGTKVKMTVKDNQVIDSTTICLICKGDVVMITANSSSISVSVAGVALNDGSKGDKIRVQNNASRRIIDAVVTDIGTVKAGI